MKMKRRLDVLLVERGLVESREKARALILAGKVLVDGQRADKAGHAVSLEARIELLEAPRYVGRGGLKLEAALDHFSIQVRDRMCLDIGSSTGGFTDCLLQRGPRACMRSTWGRASWTGNCATISELWSRSR